MTGRQYWLNFIITFAISLATTVLVNALWNLITSGTFEVNLVSSLGSALVLGLLLPWVMAKMSSLQGYAEK